MAASGYRFGNGSVRRVLQSPSPLHPRLPLMLEPVAESTSKTRVTWQADREGDGISGGRRDDGFFAALRGSARLLQPGPLRQAGNPA